MQQPVVRMGGLTKLCFQVAVLCTTIAGLFVIFIRAQPYEDYVQPGLVQDNCSLPCFLSIRPGLMSMSGAYYTLSSHEWVANSAEQFPALLRDASLIGYGIPRTEIEWQWSETAPEWIDVEYPGSIMMEDRDVRFITIHTHYRVGDLLLALGRPDQFWFEKSSTQGFSLYAWYGSRGILFSAQGICPFPNVYDARTTLRFEPVAPTLDMSEQRENLCHY